MSLKIMPKIDENYNGEDYPYIKYIEDKLEIQMIDNDLSESFKKCVKVIECFPNLKYVTLHLPERLVDIGLLSVYLRYRNDFILLLDNCVNYTIDKDLHIDVLVHARMNLDNLKDIGGISFLNAMLDYLNNSNVGIIMENSLVDPCVNGIDKDVYCNLGRMIKHKHFALCLDICHLQVSENMMKTELKFSKELLDNIKNIHFCATLNDDGYIDKVNTHGKCHNDIEHLKNDLGYLILKGIDVEKVNLVTEICEGDYFNRPCMIKELGLFEDLLKK